MPPPYKITRGQSLSLLPFGNIAVTMTVNGAELKTMLENGVSRSVSTDPATLNQPSAQGRFPQVSGLCFTWTPNMPPGSRVTSVVRADAAGNCTTTAVDLTAAASYMIVQNDFTATGGDGYPNFASRMASQEILEEITADYVTANSPLNPGRQGRAERPDQLRRHQRRGPAELPGADPVAAFAVAHSLAPRDVRHRSPSTAAGASFLS